MVEPTHLKNFSQIGHLPQIGMKMKKYLKPPPSNSWRIHLYATFFYWILVMRKEFLCLGPLEKCWRKRENRFASSKSTLDDLFASTLGLALHQRFSSFLVSVWGCFFEPNISFDGFDNCEYPSQKLRCSLKRDHLKRHTDCLLKHHLKMGKLLLFRGVWPISCLVGSRRSWS